MRLNSKNSKASDFDEVAQTQANAFWFYLIVSGIVYHFYGLWFIIPFVTAFVVAFFSVHCTITADKLRNGTYKIPNPNNGKDI